MFYTFAMSLEEKMNRVLLSLYDLTQSNPHVDIYELEKLADVGDQFYTILRYLGGPGEDLLKKENEVVRIKGAGIRKAEELLKMQMVEKQRVVLRKIYDLGGPTHMDFVLIETLVKELGMPFRELNGILLEFERKKGWLEKDCPDEAVQLSPAGVREVENPSSEWRGGGTTIQNIFHGPVQGGFIQGGEANVQHNTFANNPNVEETVSTLVGIIRESDIDASDKEDIIKDVERVKELASKEKTPDSLQRVNRRIEMIKTGIEAADTVEKGGKLLLKATPYLVMLWKLLST